MSRIPRRLSQSTADPSTSQPVEPRQSRGSRIPCPVAQARRGSTASQQTQPRASTFGVPARVSQAGRQSGAVRPAPAAAHDPLLLQKRVFRKALSKSEKQPGKKVRSVGTAASVVPPPRKKTKRGEECVVQSVSVETVLEKTPKGQYVGKTLTGVALDPTGVARQIQLTSQQIDPSQAQEKLGIKQTISVTSAVSLTSGGKQISKMCKKQTLIAPDMAEKTNLNPHHVNRLIKEEAEDVENTLKMVPPNLVNSSIDKFPLKKKLQKLRLNAEPVSLLTQSVIQPVPTADEVDAEAPPEVMATVIDAVEKGATPESTTNQIFNSLFPEVEEPRIAVSSVAPGPMEDIVVPTEQALTLVDEVLTAEMQEFIDNEVQNKAEMPKDDICTTKNITAPERTPKGENKNPDMFLEGEPAPWEDMTIRKISDLVGGDPIDLLDTSDIKTMESPEEITQELAKGIEYFLDADVVPYETKIQIRGSKIPAWFPGYMSAFPHLPELVKITRSPSEVLHAAWKAVQPKVFPEESIIVM